MPRPLSGLRSVLVFSRATKGSSEHRPHPQALHEEGEYRQLEFWPENGAKLRYLFYATPNAVKINGDFFSQYIKNTGPKKYRRRARGWPLSSPMNNFSACRFFLAEKHLSDPSAPRWVRHSYLSKGLRLIPYTCGSSNINQHSKTIKQISKEACGYVDEVCATSNKINGLTQVALDPFASMSVSNLKQTILEIHNAVVAL